MSYLEAGGGWDEKRPIHIYEEGTSADLGALNVVREKGVAGVRQSKKVEE